MIKEYQQVNRESSVQFRISRMEDIWAEQGGEPDAPHRHGYYTVILAEDAEGTHDIDYNRYDLTAKSLFFVSPGQVHQVIATRPGQGYALLFSTEFLLNNGIELCFLNQLHLFNDYGDTPPFHLSEEQFNRLKGYTEEMIALKDSSLIYREQAIGALLKLFLLYVNSWNSEEDATSLTRETGSDLIQRFRALVETHYSQWHTGSSYAEELGISADHLNRTLKQLVGKTAKEFIQSRLTVEAQRMLTFSDLTTKEICYELGFTEPGNFSAFFKKRTGQSPSEFKKSLTVGNS